MDGTGRRGEILNDNEGEREYIVMCNFHTVLVGSSGNIESPCSLLLITSSSPSHLLFPPPR